MRGKVGSFLSVGCGARITPAYAGKSYSLALFLGLHRDHPRVCGEKVSHCELLPRLLGSPPRMRGKVLSIHFLCRYLRDHPRVCGEKFRLPARLSARLGSPPRMRGKDSCTGKTPLGCRITPAYAGKSQFLPTAFHRVRDHPRVCGEKTKKIPSHRPFQLHPVPVSFSFA